MRLKKKITLNRNNNNILIERNKYGIPEITANNIVDASYAIGFVHANDRQMHIMLTRVLLEGKASEKLADEPGLIEIDRFMRRMNFLPNMQKEVEKLEPKAKEQLQAYADGVNYFLDNNKAIFDFKLVGYKPEKWKIEDSLLLSKVFGFIGLVDAQMAMEKLIVQMTQNNVEEDKLKELFPYMTETIDYELLKKIKIQDAIVPSAVKWFSKLPRFNASNSWIISGQHTKSGKPILSGDPHLEGNRLPNVWAEIVIHLPENKLTGVTIPGYPGMPIGRNNHIAWTATFSFMDMLDYRIEHCKDGKYKRENDEWIAYEPRIEKIKTKKGKIIEEKIYENENGLLEGNPFEEGHYLALKWSAQDDCGASESNCLLNFYEVKTVKEAQAQFRKLDASTFNFSIVDVEGNIGYQMSGRMFKRPKGTSGLIPLPAWIKGNEYQGYVDKEDLPTQYNPENGMIITTNQDLNYLGKASPINLPMATYRHDRIKQLLDKPEKKDLAYMKKMHYDLLSVQAERFMEMIKPLIPNNENGNILSNWDCKYDKESLGATIFESVYIEILKVVFGDNGFGRDVVEQVMKETGLFNDYYGNFDNVIFKEKSTWYGNKTRAELLTFAIEEGLKKEVKPYGETRKVLLANMLFGEKFPKFFGFDYGPISLPGNRATIPQGQIFKSANRITTFTPSFRFLTDMIGNEVHTNMLGGVSDRRFSKLYTNDIENWFNGIYKIMK